MKNHMTNNQIINVSILTIILYCGISTLRHPVGWEVITLMILPLLYKLSMKINSLKIKSVTSIVLSITYGLLSTFFLALCLLSGFIEHSDLMISLRNLGENSPLILGYMILAFVIYREWPNTRCTNIK
ncbi:hypothetical protein [Clostridium peptidivorans]|uniref:hypothetical protein n=1 Tax=Clostridium peptidivorans TaxID=100174 RepID=UPI000BE40B76|nr:hypothetical protein [Clostridium peptidivorans]